MDVSERLAALERRMAALEHPPPPSVEDADALWAINALATQGEEPGSVLLAGTVTLPDGRPVRWQEARGLPGLLDVAVDQVADSLGALGNPVRLRILLRLLHEPQTVQELTSIEGIGTTGQVYHHLRQLTATGWARTPGGGRYEVPVARVVPLLGALLSAGP
jgi:DNA-binding transcriptional ArsR family regulator